MKFEFTRAVLLTVVAALVTTTASAQDLGPHFKKLKEGIFVYAQTAADSNATIIVTNEGVVLIDSGHHRQIQSLLPGRSKSSDLNRCVILSTTSRTPITPPAIGCSPRRR